MIRIPPEVTAWIRGVFELAGQNAASKLVMNPNAHEPWIDFSIIETLQRFSSPYMVTEGWNVHLDTHWLGGYPLYERWEVADFGVLVLFATGSKLVRSKIALLQAKRLYATGHRPETEDEFREYYRHGFGRMYLQDEMIAQAFKQTVFTFDNASTYGALVKDDEQWEIIKKYEKDKQIPVYYLLYNPPTLPVDVQIPHIGAPAQDQDDVGCRVIPAQHVRAAMAAANKGDVPTYGDIRTNLDSPFKRAPHRGGWRLEHFIANLLIQCKTGRITDIRQDEGLFAAFYQRTRPIRAAISILIDAPAGFEWDVEEDTDEGL
jgi:hypothetical protein